MSKFLKIFLITFTLMIFLTGCWDTKEINDRAFVNAIFIEKNFTNKPSELVSSKGSERDKEELLITYGIVSTAEGEASLKTATTTIAATTLADAEEKLDSQTSDTPFFGHTKLIVFGKGILEDPKLMQSIMDDLERKVLIDRGIKIVATDNSKVTLDDIRPATEMLYSSYTTGVMSSAKSISYSVSMNMDRLFQNMRESNGKGMIPVVRVENGSIKMDRLALLKDYKLKEVMNPREIRNYKLFEGKDQNIKEYTDLNGFLTTFKLTAINRNITYIKGGDHPKYHIEYIFEGAVENYTFEKQIYNPKSTTKIKEDLKSSLKLQLEECQDYFQNKLGVDYLGLDEFTRKYHPKEYKKYKNWDEAFQKAEISYGVNVDIVDFGDTK